MARLQARAAYEVQQEPPLSAAALAAGVLSECGIRRLSTAPPQPLLPSPWRIVQGATDRRQPDGTPTVVVLVTNPAWTWPQSW